MKKVFLILALIGFGFVANAQTGYYTVQVNVSVTKVYYYANGTYSFSQSYRSESQTVEVYASSPSNAQQNAENRCASMCKADDPYGQETVDGTKYNVKLQRRVTGSYITKKP